MRCIYFFMGVSVMGLGRYPGSEAESTFLDGSGKRGNRHCDAHDGTNLEECVKDTQCGFNDKDAAKDCENCSEHKKDEKCEEFLGCSDNGESCVACAGVSEPNTENCRKHWCGVEGGHCKDCDLADGAGNDSMCENIHGCNFIEKNNDCVACVSFNNNKNECLNNECGFSSTGNECVDCDVFDTATEKDCEAASGCAWMGEKLGNCESVMDMCSKNKCNEACDALETEGKCKGSEKFCAHSGDKCTAKAQ